MIDATSLFSEKEIVIGHIETSAGGVLLTDGGWEEDLPKTTQESLALDLDIDPGKIPVIATRKNNKRFLILAIDDAEPQSLVSDKVEIKDQVDVPEEEPEEESEEK